MRVGWLQDEGSYIGGAELTAAEFQEAAPEGTTIVPCRVGESWQSCDVYVIQNCVLYTREMLEQLEGAYVVKYWHDVGPHLQPGVREWLDTGASHVCCSPLQAEHMNLGAVLIPPALDLSRFEQAAASTNGNRAGAVSVASWRNFGKAPHKVAEWARENGGVDFYGGGPFAPPNAVEVAYDAMPELLARYQTFVYLPTVIEPFGRLVAEAWAAGLEVVTNGLVGARYWIEERPEALETAAEDFWGVVLS